MEYAEQIGFLLPDSLRTPEQNAIRDKFVKVAFANTEITRAPDPATKAGCP